MIQRMLSSRSTTHLPLFFAMLALLLAPGAGWADIINGDFETGDFTGWTLFTTASGSLGAPAVQSFDTNNDSAATLSAAFQVGATDFSNPGPWGGGILQSISTIAGSLSLSADIAAQAPLANGSGALFELLLDGFVVDSFDFEGIDTNTTEFGTLSANLNVDAGSHEVQIRMVRPFTTSPNVPTQYIDNVTASGSAIAVPEPADLSFALVAVAALLFAGRRGRQRDPVH